MNTNTKLSGKMAMTKNAVPVVITSLCTRYAMMNSTTTMAMVSAVYCQARPRTKIKHMKMDKLGSVVKNQGCEEVTPRIQQLLAESRTVSYQKVLFMDAAPSRADNETDIVFLVFLPA